MNPKQTGKSARKKGELRSSLKKSTSHPFPFLKNLVDILPEAVITTDIQTTITGWNAAAERMYGWKASEVVGKPIEDFLHTQYQNTDQDEAVATVIENGLWFNTVTQLRKNGTRIPVISSVSVIKNDHGEPVGYVGINRDFTREARANEFVRQQSETIEQVMDMLPAAVWVASDPECKFIYGNRYANDLLNTQDGENVSQSAEKPALCVRHFVNGRELSADEMPLQAAARTGQSQKNIEMRIESDRFEPRILLGDSAPLFDEHGKPRGAVATFHDITERRQKEALRESQTMLQSVLDAAPDAMVVINKKGEIILADKRVEAVFGYSQSELVGRSILLLVPERFRALHSKHEQNYFLSPRHRADSTLDLFALRKDGTEFPAEININHHTVGEELVAIASVRDVTERKKVQVELQKSERKFSALFNQSHDAVFLLDLQGRYVDANQRAADILGYTREELSGLSFHEISAELAQSQSIIERLLKGEHFPVYERLFRRKNGDLLPVEINIELVRDAHGNPMHLQSVARDISERKKTEKKLQASELRYRSLVENMHEIVMETDAEGMLRYLSPNYESITGYPIQEELGTPALTHVHPEDQDTLRQRLAQVARDGFGTLTYRVQVKSGAWVWVETTASLSQAEDGSPRIIGVARDITNRIETEVSLRENQSILATAEEVAKIGSWRWDLATQKVTWSDEMFRLFGVDRVGFSGDLGQILAERIHPDDMAAVNEANRSVLEDATPTPLSYRIVLPDGAVRTVWAQGKLINDEQGKPIALTGYVQDISERVRAEAQLQQMKRLYATLSQVNQTIVRIKEQDELFQSICDMVVKFGEYSLAWVGLLDEESGEIKPVAANGMDIHHWTLPIINVHNEAFKDHLTTQAIHSGMVTTSEDVQTDPRLSVMQASIKTLPYHAVAVVPIKRGGKVVGILAIVSPQAGFFKAEEELALLAEMGLDISFALDLMDNERIKQQWADAFEHSAHGMVIGDARTNTIRACNPAFAREQGVSMEEAVGMRLIDMYRPEDHERIKQLIAQSDREGTVQYEALKIRKDGSTYPCQLDLVSVRDERGNLLYRVASQQDITERKQAEEALRMETERFRHFANSNIVGIVIADASGKITLANDYYLNLLGVTRQDFLDGKVDWRKFTPPEWVPADEKALAELKERGICEPYEKEYIRADGTRVPVYIADAMLPGSSNEIAAFILDITERKQAEDAIRINEERFRNALDGMFEGVQILGFDWKYIYLNHSAEIHNRRPNSELLGNIYMDMWPGIENTHVFEVIKRCLENRVPTKLENEFTYPDGLIQWFDLSIQPTPEGVLIHSVDITERKHTEKALRESESKYRLLAENITDVIWILDIGTSLFRYISPSVEQLRGYTAEEVLHQSITEALTPSSVEYLAQTLPARLELLSKGVYESYTDDLEQPCKDGSTVWTETTTRFITNPETGHLEVYGVSRNITERKQAETALRISEENYRSLAETSDSAIAVLNREGTILYANPASLRVWEDPQLIGKSVHDLYPAKVADGYLVAFNAVLDDQEIDLSEVETTINGRTMWFRVSLSPIKNSDDTTNALLLNAWDITERKQAEEALRQSEALLSEAQKIGRIGHWEWTAPGQDLICSDELFDILELPKTGKVISQAVIAAMIEPEERQRMIDVDYAIFASRGDADYEFQVHLPSGRNIWLHQQAKITYGDDGKPLRMMGIIQDVTERKQSEEALRQSEERHRQISSLISDYAYSGVLLPDGKIKTEWVSGAFEKITGYTLEEINQLPAGFASLIPQEQFTDIIEKQAEFSTKDPHTIEYTIRRKDGEIRWLRDYLRYQNLDEVGTSNRITGAVQDITERKQAEEAIKRGERILRLFVEHSPASIAMFDRDMHYIVHSRRYVLDYQLPDQDLTGRSHYEVFPEIPNRWKDIHQRCLAGNIERADEDPFLRIDGRLDYVHWEIHPWYDDDGSVGGIILFSEVITERVRAREELMKIAQRLEESRSMLELIIESAPIRVFWKDTESRYMGCNGLFAADAGFHSPAEIIGKRDDELVWNDKAEIFQKQEREIIETGISRMDREELQVTPGGGTMWVNVSMVPLKGLGGEVIGTLGIYEDITERKQAEDALKESEERFSTAFFTSPVSQSIIAQGTNEIMAVNDACCRLFEYTREELIGSSTTKLNLWENPADRLSAVQELQSTGRLRPREATARVKSGSIHTVIVEITPIMWQGIPCLLSTIFDITERKQAEEALQENEAFISAVLDNLPIGIAVNSVDPAVKFTYMNEYFPKIYRTSREKLSDMDVFWDVVYEDPIFREEIKKKVMDDIASGDLNRNMWVDIPITRAGEETTYITARNIPFPGKPMVISTVWDVTERIQAEKAILRYNEQLAEVVEIEYALAASLDQEHIYETLQNGIRHLLPDIATIFFSSFDDERGTIKAQYGLQDMEPVDVSDLPELPYKPDGQGTQSRVIHTRQPLIINSNLKNSFKQSVQVGSDERVTQSALYVPMLVQDQVLGVLQVQSYSLNRFTDEDARVLLLIANTAAVTIQNARLFETAQKEILERTQAEKALKISEERLRLTLQTTSDGFWIVDTNGRFLEVNNAYCEMSGYSREELLQMGIPDVEAFEGSREIKERIEKVQYEDHDRFETRHRRKDGSEFDVEVSVNLLDDKSGVMICFCRDISERKQAEYEIHQRSEDLLLINALNDAANRGESIEAITEIFAREARNMFRCQDAAIYLLSPDGKHLEMQSTTLTSGLTEQIEKIIGIKIPRIRIPIRPGSYTEELIANQAGMLTDDPAEIQKWITEFTETTFLPSLLQSSFKKIIPHIFGILKINATITVPLMSSGRTIGLLDMSTKGEFTTDDLQRVRILSHQMTAVILRKQAESNVMVQLKRITALNAIDNAISGSLDLKLTLAVLLREVINQLKVDAVDILLLNPYMQTLEYSIGQGFFTTQIQKSQIRLGEGAAGLAGLERRMVQIPNLKNSDITFLRKQLVLEENFVSYICLPLIAKGQLKGVLEIFNRSPLTPDSEWIEYLGTLAGQAAIGIDNSQLFEGLQRSNMEMKMAYDATIAGWSRAMDLRDKETEGHTQRVSETTLKLANRMGISSEEQVHMRRGALLHDIGKLGVPDHILHKAGKLTDEEWQVMRQHPTYAYEMLASINYLHPALDIPYCHHEKWDGSGYPRGLKGGQIPLAARIFAIVDVWDALRSDRPYRAGWSVEKIREYILEQSGKHFDPQVVQAFMQMLDESSDLL